MKIKENEKIDKYLNLARELRKLWNMRVTVIPGEVGSLGTVPKELKRRLEELEIIGRINTIETTALLRTVRKLKRVLDTRGNFLSFRIN